MIPNKSNSCAGAFPDWLEVNLLSRCNGRCSWCIGNEGYRPRECASWKEIAEVAISTYKKNIILLGGEPTLYDHLSDMIQFLTSAGRSVWMTTNGGLLTPDFVTNNCLCLLKGINISIHDNDLLGNEEVVGVRLNSSDLYWSIAILKECGVSVRFNCNCIKGHIDSKDRILEYMSFAKRMGVGVVRLAELKNDPTLFVNLAKVLDYKFGLNDDPFILGCSNNAVLDEIAVNFRQMCGLQTIMRKKPKNPQQVSGEVLYYDGKLYPGWQKESHTMNEAELKKVLEELKNGGKTIEDAMKEIKKLEDEAHSDDGYGCKY